MKLKTLQKNGNIILKDYSDTTCNRIFIERNSYVLKRVHQWGEDYGGSQCTEDTETTYEEIPMENVLVQRSHFIGVTLLTYQSDYNGFQTKNGYKESILKIDDYPQNSIRSGSSFSNDDHSRWDYSDTYLVERPKDL